MQVRSFLLTLGLGMAAGGTVALMLPRQSGVRREAQKAADAVEQTISDAVEILEPGRPDAAEGLRSIFFRGVQQDLRERKNHAIIMAESLQKRPAANFRQQVCSLSQRSFRTFSPSRLQKCKIELLFCIFLPLRRVKERERTP